MVDERDRREHCREVRWWWGEHGSCRQGQLNAKKLLELWMLPAQMEALTLKVKG